jgi:hypothetical protein
VNRWDGYSELDNLVNVKVKDGHKYITNIRVICSGKSTTTSLVKKNSGHQMERNAGKKSQQHSLSRILHNPAYGWPANIESPSPTGTMTIGS